ncbi:uncharacterized protein LOC117650988 [Thrips palmi]|uniref:Uncharacterized protein LOC117650988 n=1 Tax=Thrips palmi TaxID=161013 RepID=A0A6P8ZYN3_THRPL|nr:uncharacterized protein LOC117650988 [Thrips palmi]
MRHSLLLATLAVLAVGGQAAQPMTQKEALELFFGGASARQKFDQALESVMALGVPGIGPLMGQWRGRGAQGAQAKSATSGLVRAPWETAVVQRHVQRVLEDSIDQLVEQVRRLIEAAAEPLKIERIDLTQSNPLFNSKGEITQVSVSQLSTFNILDRDVDVPTVSAKLTVDFEKLDVHGMYNVDATASDQLHIFGDGRFDIRLYRPTVEVSVRLGYENEYFSVEELSIYVKLEKLKVVMSNFLGGGEVGDLVCGIVSDVGPAFLDMYREEVNQALSMTIKETANALLNKLPINKIIDWIMGGGGGDDDDDDDYDDSSD